MTRETNLRSVDYSALLAPIDPAELAAFEAETRAGIPRWMPRRGAAGVPPLLVALAAIFIGLPGALILGVLLIGMFARWWGPLIGFGPAAVASIVLACLFIVPALRAPRRTFGWEQFYRLTRFALDNELAYEPESVNPAYPGVMFANAPGMCIVYNHLTSTTGRFFDIGNLRFGRPGTADTAMTESAHRGFLAVHLGGALPHIILDAKANDGLMGGVGIHFAGQPTVRLEGDFNEHFTLYCPVGYERDALYILTPDLMADLLDESLAFDVELINDWMFVYAMRPFDSMDPTIYQRLFRIVETVGQRAARRSTWYRDDQYSSPESGAAKPQGNRMPVRIPAKLVLAILAFIASMSWIPFGLFLGLFLAAL